MKYEHIHKALKDNGLSWTAVAKALDCSYQHVMNVCARRSESVRVAKAVSLLIEKDVSEVFPDVPSYQSDVKKQNQQTVEKARQKLVQAGLVEAV